MILFAEELSDVGKRSFRQVTAQIHDHLPGKNEFRVPLLGGDVFRTDAVVLCHHADDEFRRDLVGSVRVDDVLQCVFGQLKRDLRLVFDLGFGDDPVESAFQFPNVGFDIGGDILENGVVDLFVVIFRIFRKIAILVS